MPFKQKYQQKEPTLFSGKDFCDIEIRIFFCAVKSVIVSVYNHNLSFNDLI